MVFNYISLCSSDKSELKSVNSVVFKIPFASFAIFAVKPLFILTKFPKTRSKSCLKAKNSVYFQAMKKMFTIAIDGPAGSGKSSTAKRVARKLGYLFIDTGAMYRAVTLLAIRTGNIDNKQELLRLLSGSKIVLKPGKDGNIVFLNDEDITKAIRTEEINLNVSLISSIPEVRTELVRMQQEMGKLGGVVMEGRDIGSVVFPDADLKFFFTANVDERARRRHADLKESGSDISFEEVRKSIIRRDGLDSGREISPLEKTDDSIEIDTTSLTLEEQCDYIVDLVRQKEHTDE